jgi:hypothetical protein
MWGDKEKKEAEEKAKADAAAAAGQSKEQANELVTQLRASFEETLKPITEKLQAYETRFATLEENTKKPAAKVENTEIPSVIDNEDAAFNARLGPLLVQTVALKAKIAEDSVINNLTSLGWGEYASEIREVFEKRTPIQTKAAADYDVYCRNVVNMIIGEKALKEGLKRDVTKQTFFIEPSGSSNDKPESSIARLREEATDGRVDILKKSGGDISVWARKMGIDPEALAKSEA